MSDQDENIIETWVIAMHFITRSHNQVLLASARAYVCSLRPAAPTSDELDATSASGHVDGFGLHPRTGELHLRPAMRGRTHKTTPRVEGGRVQRKNHRDVRARGHGGLRVRTEPPLPGYRHYLDEEDVLTFIQLLPEWNDLSAGLREIVLADHDDACDGWYRDGRVGICAWVDAPRFEAGARWVVEHRELLDDLGVNVHRGDGTFVKAFAADPLGVPVQERGDVRAAMAEVFGVDVLEVHPGDDCAWIAVAPASTDHPAVELCDIHLIDGELHAYERTYSCRFTPAQVRAYQLLHVLTHEIGHHRDAMTRPHRGLVARGESFAEQWAYRCGREVWTRYFSELAR